MLTWRFVYCVFNSCHFIFMSHIFVRVDYVYCIVF